MRSWRTAALGAAVPVLVAAGCGSSSSHAAAAPPATPTTAAPTPFLTEFHTVTQLASTVPANGDVNPYGVATVSASGGNLVAGDVLVSNFNSKANVQGTGTTIVEVSPSGTSRLFAQISQLPAGDACPGGIGLSTALAVLPGGWVVVGSLPTGKGGALPKPNPVGCLIVLNDAGQVAETISNRDVIGPWDMAVQATSTSATLYVSNALGGNTSTENGVPVKGNCTVARINLTLSASAPPVVAGTTVIGKGFPWTANQAALVLAPTGLALGPTGTLYVDDTQTNTVSAIADAPTRTTPVSPHTDLLTSGGSLNQPLGMGLAPNGDVVVVDGGDGNAIEISPAGRQVATVALVKNGAGDLFGITPTPSGDGLLFVNDGTNALDLYH